jgi:F0F1-type ATP synthase assembly protein I
MVMGIWNEPRGLMRYASMGMKFTVTVLGPAALGYWLDSQARTGPGFLLLLAGAGFALGLWRLIGQAIRIRREYQTRGEDGPPPAA